MTQKKNTSGIFAEVKVQDRKQDVESTVDSQWRYIRITYPNGVTITVPSSITPERLSSLVYLR